MIKLFFKESTKLEHFQNKVLHEELEKCLTSLELNSQSSTVITMTNGEMSVRSLDKIETNTLSTDRRYSEITPTCRSSLKPFFQVSATTTTTPMKTHAPIFEFRLPPEKSPISTPTCCRSRLSTKPIISNCNRPVPLSPIQAKFKNPGLATASSVPSKSPSPSRFSSKRLNSFQEHTLSPKVAIVTSPGKNTSMLPSKPMISSASTTQISAVPACATSEPVKITKTIKVHKEHFTSTTSNFNCSSSPHTKADSSAATLEWKFSSITSETPRSTKTQGQIGSLIQTSTTSPVSYSNTLSSKALISCTSTSALKTKCTSAPLSSNSVVSSKQIYYPPSSSIIASKKLDVRTSPVTLSDVSRASPQNTASIFALASENRCFDKTKNSKSLEKDRNLASPLKNPLSNLKPSLTATTSSQTVSRNYICPSSTSVKTSTSSKNSLGHVLKERRNNVNSASPANPTLERSITPSTTYINYRIPREQLRFELMEPHQSENFYQLTADDKNAMYTVLKLRTATKSSLRHLATRSSPSTLIPKSIPQQSLKSVRPKAKATLNPRPKLTEVLHGSIREFVHVNAEEMLHYYFYFKFFLLAFKTLNNVI